MRWHPLHCPGFETRDGCIINIDDWGPAGNTPVGTFEQRCSAHQIAEVQAVYDENVRVVQAENARNPPVPHVCN